MPIPSSLPKGSAAVRGCSDVPHIRSVGGQSANTANRLYMFIVRRGSLCNKKRSLEIRLDEINQQLRGLELNIVNIKTEIESDLHAIETKYRDRLDPGGHGRRRASGKPAEQAKGRSVRTMSFQY